MFLRDIGSNFRAAALGSGKQAVRKKETAMKSFSPIISEVRNVVILNFLWIDGIPCLLLAFFLFSFLHAISLADKPSLGLTDSPEGS